MPNPTAEELINEANETDEDEEVDIEEGFKAQLSSIEETEAKFKKWADSADTSKKHDIALLYKRIATELLPLMTEQVANNAVAFNEVLLELYGEEEEGDAVVGDAEAPEGSVVVDKPSLEALYRLCRTLNHFLSAGVTNKAFKGKAKVEVDNLLRMLVGVEISGKDSFGFERDEADTNLAEAFDAAFNG